MAIKFVTCYPRMPRGGKAPLGIALDKDTGQIREIICPELSEPTCAELARLWNAAPGCAPDSRELSDCLEAAFTALLDGLPT
jgi:hypothetical protein